MTAKKKQYKNTMLQIGALWKKTREDGTEYLCGRFGDYATLHVFENNYKKTDKHPDFNVVISENE